MYYQELEIIRKMRAEVMSRKDKELYSALFLQNLQGNGRTRLCIGQRMVVVL